MIDLKDLQAMAKNSEISEKLLGDEEFKSEFKKMIKEETGLEITDEQIPEIIKNFENSLQDEKVLKEAELEAVSGGANLPESEEEDMERLYKHYDNIRRGIGISGSIVSALGTIALACTAGKAADNKFGKHTATSTAAKMVAGAGLGVTDFTFRRLSWKVGDEIACRLYKRALRKRAKAKGMDK